MDRIVTADIGGTHARFALAQVEGGRVAHLDEAVTLKTAEHASFSAAWREFERRTGAILPSDLALAFAGPVGGDTLKLTNSDWVIRMAGLGEELGIARCTIVNDLGAVAHAVASLAPAHFGHLCGPARALPNEGVISIVGPGTGLGVAILVRKGVSYKVIETEAGHVDFAPIDAIEDRVLVELRRCFGRVSVERIVSGPGLWNLYQALAAIEGRDPALANEQALWAAAIAGKDGLAVAALDRFCLTLGSVTGDCALAQGAMAVVVAGGLGLRLADRLPQSGFRDRFIGKGRFERRMDDMPVKIVSYPEPGLFGAAAAFAREYR